MPISPVEMIWSGAIALTLVAMGGFYLLREWLEWRRQDGFCRHHPADAGHFRNQFYRRAVGCLLLVAAGLTIFVCQGLLDWRESPRVYMGLWTGVALGLFGVVALAGADIWSIRRYARRHRQKLDADRREMLARQIEQYQLERNTFRGVPPDFDVEQN